MWDLEQQNYWYLKNVCKSAVDQLMKGIIQVVFCFCIDCQSMQWSLVLCSFALSLHSVDSVLYVSSEPIISYHKPNELFVWQLLCIQCLIEIDKIWFQYNIFLPYFYFDLIKTDLYLFDMNDKNHSNVLFSRIDSKTTFCWI